MIHKYLLQLQGFFTFVLNRVEFKFYLVSMLQKINSISLTEFLMEFIIIYRFKESILLFTTITVQIILVIVKLFALIVSGDSNIAENGIWRKCQKLIRSKWQTNIPKSLT
jgi:hypothetical protein